MSAHQTWLTRSINSRPSRYGQTLFRGAGLLVFGRCQQCRLLAVSRSSVYRRQPEVSEQDRTIMAQIDRQYLARSYYGSRRMAAWLAMQGHLVNRKRVQRLMLSMGLVAPTAPGPRARPSRAVPPGSVAEPSCQKIVFYLQPANLPVQNINLRLASATLRRCASTLKNAGRAV
jgi:transposase InsO family protein